MTLLRGRGRNLARGLLCLLLALGLAACATERPRGTLTYGMDDSPEGKQVVFPPDPEVPRYAYAGQLIGDLDCPRGVSSHEDLQLADCLLAASLVLGHEGLVSRQFTLGKTHLGCRAAFIGEGICETIPDDFESGFQKFVGFPGERNLLVRLGQSEPGSYHLGSERCPASPIDIPLSLSVCD